MKYTLTFITLFAGLFCTKVNAQGWQWGAGGTGPNGEAMAPATDAWGNVYTIGYYVATTATFGTLVLPGTAGAFNDMILIKYDSRGNLVWGVRLPVFPASIATDNEGDLYMLGTLGGTVNLGGVTLTDPSTTKPAMFVAKFGPSGNAIWGDILGTLSFLDGEIAASNEVVYITGSYFAASQQIGPFTVTNTDPSGATNDIFLAKLDVNGNVKWAKGTGGSGQEYSTSVAVTPTGQAYIAGNFTSPTIPFGSTVLSPTAGKSIFLAKYDTSGNVLWATSPNGPTGFPDTYVTSDHAGSAILSGTLPQYCTMAFGTHALTNTSIYTNGYVAKYSPGGIAQWAKEVAGFAVQVWGAEADACDDIRYRRDLWTRCFLPNLTLAATTLPTVFLLPAAMMISAWALMA